LIGKRTSGRDKCISLLPLHFFTAMTYFAIKRNDLDLLNNKMEEKEVSKILYTFFFPMSIL